MLILAATAMLESRRSSAGFNLERLAQSAEALAIAGRRHSHLAAEQPREKARVAVADILCDRLDRT